MVGRLPLQMDSGGVGADQEDAGGPPGHHGESPSRDCRLPQHLARPHVLEVVPKLRGECDLVKNRFYLLFIMLFSIFQKDLFRGQPIQTEKLLRRLDEAFRKRRDLLQELRDLPSSESSSKSFRVAPYIVPYFNFMTCRRKVQIPLRYGDLPSARLGVHLQRP